MNTEPTRNLASGPAVEVPTDVRIGQRFRPYKGPDSYQSEDADFFFGRDREAGQLLNLILSSHATLLHAQSGAGKTSLLNAYIIPSLTAEGCLPVRSLPQNDPLSAVREATLHQALLHPDLERRAVERARSVLAEPGEDLSVGELLDRYDQLKKRDERQRELATPLKSSLTVGGLPVATEAFVTPFSGYNGFCGSCSTPFIEPETSKFSSQLSA